VKWKHWIENTFTFLFLNSHSIWDLILSNECQQPDGIFHSKIYKVVPSGYPRSSAMLRSVDWYVVTDDSGQPIRPETMRNTLQKRIAQLHRVLNLESLYIYLEESQTNYNDVRNHRKGQYIWQWRQTYGSKSFSQQLLQLLMRMKGGKSIHIHIMKSDNWTYFNKCILVLKLVKISKSRIVSFGWFPGFWILCAEVSEHSVCSVFIGRLVPADGTECSETSARTIQKPTNHPKERIQN